MSKNKIIILDMPTEVPKAPNHRLYYDDVDTQNYIDLLPPHNDLKRILAAALVRGLSNNSSPIIRGLPSPEWLYEVEIKIIPMNSTKLTLYYLSATDEYEFCIYDPVKQLSIVAYTHPTNRFIDPNYIHSHTSRSSGGRLTRLGKRFKANELHDFILKFNFDDHIETS